MDVRPPLPPFTPETARQKVRMAEDAWNSRDPDRVVLVYTDDTRHQGNVQRVAGAGAGSHARPALRNGLAPPGNESKHALSVDPFGG